MSDYVVVGQDDDGTLIIVPDAVKIERRENEEFAGMMQDIMDDVGFEANVLSVACAGMARETEELFA